MGCPPSRWRRSWRCTRWSSRRWSACRRKARSCRARRSRRRRRSRRSRARSRWRSSREQQLEQRWRPRRHARAEDDEEGQRVKPRATIFTVHNETLEVATTVAAADLADPGGLQGKEVDDSGDARQIDHEARPLPVLALEIDPAAALLHDPVDGRQPEPGALPLLLGREERLEDVRRTSPGMPCPVSVTVSGT